MKEFAPGVARLQVSIANVFFAGAPGSPWALLDAGTPGQARKIRQAAEARYGAGARPAGIFLTHGHYDHAGSARELADLWDAPIYAHRLELPFLDGRSAYPPKDPTVGGSMALLSRFFPAPAVDAGIRLRALEEAELPGLPGWRWLHTPGHTPGHVVFWHESTATLIAGDAVVTMDLDSVRGLVTQARRISRPPAPFTTDWVQARRSVELLAQLKPRHLGAGHGLPMSGAAVAEDLSHLAEHFPVPAHGRYVAEPARAGEDGIVYLPPPVRDPLPAVAAGAAIGLIAVSVWLARRSRRDE